MAVTLMGLFAFSLIFLIVLGFISNQNPTALSGIQTQFNRLTCPFPSSSGLWNNTGTLEYTNGTYNYPSVNVRNITLTCTSVHTLNGFDYFYGTGAGVPFAGMVFFIGDLLSELVDKAIAFFTLAGFYLLPINFTILGYTITSMSANAQMAIIGVYGFCYIFIGIGIYKIVSPFSGAG